MLKNCCYKEFCKAIRLFKKSFGFLFISTYMSLEYTSTYLFTRFQMIVSLICIFSESFFEYIFIFLLYNVMIFFVGFISIVILLLLKYKIYKFSVLGIYLTFKYKVIIIYSLFYSKNITFLYYEYIIHKFTKKYEPTT